MIGVSVEDSLAKISDLADAAEPVAYPEEFDIDTDESSEEVEAVTTLASADGTGDGEAGDGDAADPETAEVEEPEAKVAGPAAWRQICQIGVQLLCGFV